MAAGLLFTALIPCAIAGLALINTGLGRARGAAHAMVTALCAVAVAAIAFVCIGYALQTDAPSIGIPFAGRNWNLIGAGPLFLRGVETSGIRAVSLALLQLLSVALAALIPLGTGADRWRFTAVCYSTALLAAFTYPVFTHWSTGGGWLARLGVDYGLGRGFVDGGSGAIQSVGGLTALAIAWILGPRRGKFGSQGRSLAIPGHNAVLVLTGCFLAWIGWLGLNGAWAVLVSGAVPQAAVLSAINTTLTASAAALAAAAVTKVRFARPDASLIANGWLCGLVTSGAGCAFLAPAEAAATGLAAGILVVFCVEFLEAKLLIDDPAGAISVHAAGGLWGLLAAGVFGRFPSGHAAGQWLAQLAGIATLIGFVLPLSYVLNAILNRLHPQRIPPAAELQGADLYELGAGAYPEFVIHSEDLSGRR